MRDPLAVTLAVLTFALAVAAHPQASISNKPKIPVCPWNNPTNCGMYDPWRVSPQGLYYAAVHSRVR